MNWHTLETKTALDGLVSSISTGLTSEQVNERTNKYGVNELIEYGGRTALQILWGQITATMVLILIGAAVVAGLLGDIKNSVAILVILALYVFLGFIQEYRAEQTIASLKKMSVPNVQVLRDGQMQELAARELVPGDIIQLETGHVIPADMRLLETANLRIQEAALTGESEPIEKHTAALSGEDLPLVDRRNMSYMGSIVTRGRGLALVVATGMETELGKIAELIQQVQSQQTPLQRRLDALGKNLALIGLAISALIFALGILRGDELRHMLLTAVSVAVAIVPEGLPAVVIVTLSLGAQRMLQREILIRKLPAVETLGSVTVICSDKTGTLTENRMTVLVLDVAEHAINLTETLERDGSLHATRGLGAPVESSLSLAAIGGSLCNDAKLIDTGDDRFHTLGDATEGALVVAAAKMGYWKSSLDLFFPRAAELPFDSERKRMSTVHHLGKYDPTMLSGLEIGDKQYIAFTKGGVDGLLDITSHIWVEGKSLELDADWRSTIEAANERLAKKGMRVLGVAFRLLDSIPEIIQTDLEQNLTLVGMFGMIDPPRSDVRDAVATCRSAGIRPVMITGDHPLTAIEIARQLGIVPSVPAAVPGGEDAASSIKALTGKEIENLSFEELKNAVDEVNVFASVAPEHKLRIVQTLQEKGHIVAMTGDSVNDAPALRKADIGVAMGLTGTDVSKEASDLVLLNDNFATIVTAVQEGRTVSANIRKFLRFSVAGNIGKVLVMLTAPFLGKSLPLLPLQLLWLNLLTDGLLGLGMGMENPEPDIMKRKAYSPTEGLFSRRAGAQPIWLGVLIGALALGLGCWYFFTGRPEWQTMIFTSLAFMQVFQALASRSGKESLFKMGLLSNPWLAGMALLAIVLQMMVMYKPALAGYFEVSPLSGCDLSIAAAAGVIVFVAMEMEKKFKS
ncbi:MAG: cation-translocating P-type ATPase [Anaerolineaceae bacterium]|nr:MAG: cation-translocating P-type ATPase [Anaerolineaceae bacterium]